MFRRVRPKRLPITMPRSTAGSPRFKSKAKPSARRPRSGCEAAAMLRCRRSRGSILRAVLLAPPHDAERGASLPCEEARAAGEVKPADVERSLTTRAEGHSEDGRGSVGRSRRAEAIAWSFPGGLGGWRRRVAHTDPPPRRLGGTDGDSRARISGRTLPAGSKQAGAAARHAGRFERPAAGAGPLADGERPAADGPRAWSIGSGSIISESGSWPRRITSA